MFILHVLHVRNRMLHNQNATRKNQQTEAGLAWLAFSSVRVSCDAGLHLMCKKQKCMASHGALFQEGSNNMSLTNKDSLECTGCPALILVQVLCMTVSAAEIYQSDAVRSTAIGTVGDTDSVSCQCRSGLIHTPN